MRAYMCTEWAKFFGWWRGVKDQIAASVELDALFSNTKASIGPQVMPTITLEGQRVDARRWAAHDQEPIEESIARGIEAAFKTGSGPP